MLHKPAKSLIKFSIRRDLSVFSCVVAAKQDAILGLNEEFRSDTSKDKINLIVGAYRDNEGRPVVLPSVRIAEQRIFQRNEDHEYAGIHGIPQFIDKSLEFVFGMDSTILKEKRVAAIQTLSGTGACRIAAEFISSSFSNKSIMLPDPTWPNHANIFKQARLEPDYYPYYNHKTQSFCFDSMKEYISSAVPNSWILLHSCAHNPTGYDPSYAQWEELSEIILKRGHHVVFDCAYQGFASGDPEADAFAVRLFADRGHNFILAQSFAKNFGLYGERVGTVSVVTSSPAEAATVNSQLKRLARAMYSNPPIYGAKIVAEILSNQELKSQWQAECRAMAKRIIEMRTLLVSKLTESGSKKNWSHITDQIGMFSFLGLTVEQVLMLRSKYHIYCTEDSRISIAGVTTNNVDYLAKAIHEVTS